MKVSIKGKLLSLYKSPDFKDRDTGEVMSIGKYKLSLLVESELSNGSVKNDIQDVSIPDSQVKDYEPQVGKEVSVNCSYVSKSQVSFYVS
jgi:hypothetical protein